MAGEFDRFITAATSGPPTHEQRELVLHNQDGVLKAAFAFSGVPEGRERALAFTKLEEALMWANKAVFQTNT